MKHLHKSENLKFLPAQAGEIRNLKWILNHLPISSFIGIFGRIGVLVFIGLLGYCLPAQTGVIGLFLSPVLATDLSNIGTLSPIGNIERIDLNWNNDL